MGEPRGVTVSVVILGGDTPPVSAGECRLVQILPGVCKWVPVEKPPDG